MAEENNDIFHFEKDRSNFEDFSHPHKIRSWKGRDLMAMLGYDDFPSFERHIQEAMAFCNELGIDAKTNFQSLTSKSDYHLSKFACYLISMKCDANKKEVKSARFYFNSVVDSFHCYLREHNLTEIGSNDLYSPFKDKKTLNLFNISYSEKRNLKNSTQMISFRFNESVH